ncbi:cation:proton antiporter domain-containing protein [Streptomyces rochei]|uniref:cation:proton antiporter domain-containing protein n=1 Tax=Streptomyces rochei TaxID=1928 RepID=UPI00403935C4
MRRLQRGKPSVSRAFAVYGLTTVAHGSGFLAVFVAGVLLGDVRAPYKKEIERFHTALGSLGEVVAFTLLGLTVPLWTFTMEGAWTDGIVLAVLLACVIRPLVLTALLWPMDLSRGEKRSSPSPDSRVLCRFFSVATS